MVIEKTLIPKHLRKMQSGWYLKFFPSKKEKNGNKAFVKEEQRS